MTTIKRRNGQRVARNSVNSRLFRHALRATHCALLVFASTLAQAAPDPTLLPVATTAQSPKTSQYAALNVPGLAAGASYLDPTTGVKIYKLTSASFPGSGSYHHDYGEGGDEVSLPYKSDGTRAVLVRTDSFGFYLIDFNPTANPTVSNARTFPSGVKPVTDLNFSFSNNPATPWYAYVLNGSSLIRIDIRTLTAAPGNGFPIAATGNWLHQSANDALFTWLDANGSTVYGYEPATATKKTPTNAGNINEPRLLRGGRYIGFSMNSPANGATIWDFQTNTIIYTSNGSIPYAHQASLDDRWIGTDWNISYPDTFWELVPGVSPVTIHDIPNAGPALATLTYGNGNWIQTGAGANAWALVSSYGNEADQGWLAPRGMVYVNSAGGRRLLGHPYATNGDYTYYSFPKQTSDGYYVLFTSDMNGSSRYDLFLAEVPANGTPPPPPPPSDTTAPSVPTGLSATATSMTQINLSWTASTDNVAVTGYNVFRGGTQIATPSGTTYSDTGLTASTLYSYTVSAFDAAGNTSAQSASASATTSAPPSLILTGGSASGAAGATVDLPVTFTSGSTAVSAIQFDLTSLPAGVTFNSVAAGASATAASKTVTGAAITNGARILIYGQNQTAIATGVVATVRFNLASSVAVGAISVPITNITASDPSASGVTLTSSNGTITVTSAADTTPPTVSITAPTNGASVSGSAVTVSATASDNVGVVGVQFKLDGNNLNAEDKTSPYSISWNASAATNGTHTLTAVARDAAGNTTTSTSISVTVANPTITSFTASPTTISSGGSSTLTWATTNGTTLSIDNGVGTVTGLTSKSVSPTVTTIYTLTATNGSASVTKTVTVTVSGTVAPAPTITLFTASPTSIASGSSSLLAWTATNATTLTINNSVGTVTGLTTTPVSPTVTTIYTLTATNSTGSVTKNVTVTVTGSSGGGGTTILPVPTFSIPDTIAVNSILSVSYPAGYPNVSFSWTITPIGGIGGSAAGRFGATPPSPLAPSPTQTFGAPNAAFKTTSGLAPLAPYALTPGAYTITVQAVDSVNPANNSAIVSKTVSLVSADLSAVRVYPNPWRSDKHAGKSITFDTLTLGCTVKIFTVSGHQVKSLTPSGTSIPWDLTNDSGDKVASGIYVYLITDTTGGKATGKVAVIK